MIMEVFPTLVILVLQCTFWFVRAKQSDISVSMARNCAWWLSGLVSHWVELEQSPLLRVSFLMGLKSFQMSAPRHHPRDLSQMFLRESALLLGNQLAVKQLFPSQLQSANSFYVRAPLFCLTSRSLLARFTHLQRCVGSQVGPAS